VVFFNALLSYTLVTVKNTIMKQTVNFGSDVLTPDPSKLVNKIGIFEPNLYSGGRFRFYSTKIKTSICNGAFYSFAPTYTDKSITIYYYQLTQEDYQKVTTIVPRSMSCIKFGLKGFGLNWFQIKCVSSCPDDHYFDYTNNFCEKCNEHCSKCKPYSKYCETCEDGYYLFNNRLCQKCQEPCQTCSGSPTNCTSCLGGAEALSANPTNVYFKCNEKCVKKIQNCLMCNYDITKCIICEDSYILQSNGRCVKPVSSQNAASQPVKFADELLQTIMVTEPEAKKKLLIVQTPPPPPNFIYIRQNYTVDVSAYVDDTKKETTPSLIPCDQCSYCQLNGIPTCQHCPLCQKPCVYETVYETGTSIISVQGPVKFNTKIYELSVLGLRVKLDTFPDKVLFIFSPTNPSFKVPIKIKNSYLSYTKNCRNDVDSVIELINPSYRSPEEIKRVEILNNAYQSVLTSLTGVSAALAPSLTNSIFSFFFSNQIFLYMKFFNINISGMYEFILKIVSVKEIQNFDTSLFFDAEDYFSLQATMTHFSQCLVDVGVSNIYAIVAVAISMVSGVLNLVQGALRKREFVNGEVRHETALRRLKKVQEIISSLDKFINQMLLFTIIPNFGILLKKSLIIQTPMKRGLYLLCVYINAHMALQSLFEKLPKPSDTSRIAEYKVQFEQTFYLQNRLDKFSTTIVLFLMIVGFRFGALVFAVVCLLQFMKLVLLMHLITVDVFKASIMQIVSTGLMSVYFISAFSTRVLNGLNVDTFMLITCGLITLSKLVFIGSKFFFLRGLQRRLHSID